MGLEKSLFLEPGAADSFECALCLEISYPLSIFPCTATHFFCIACIAPLSKKVCPLCRENCSPKATKSVIEAPIRRIFNNLSVKCPSEGCNWASSLGNLEQHLSECSKTVVDTIQCSLCNETIDKNKEREHKEACASFPETCPIGGRECESIPRSLVISHLEETCPYAIVACKKCSQLCIRGDEKWHCNSRRDIKNNNTSVYYGDNYSGNNYGDNNGKGKGEKQLDRGSKGGNQEGEKLDQKNKNTRGRVTTITKTTKFNTIKKTTSDKKLAEFKIPKEYEFLLDLGFTKAQIRRFVMQQSNNNPKDNPSFATQTEEKRESKIEMVEESKTKDKNKEIRNKPVSTSSSKKRPPEDSFLPRKKKTKSEEHIIVID